MVEEGVVLQGIAEKVPACGGVNGIFVNGRHLKVGWVRHPCRRDAHILGRHGEGVASDGRAVDIVGSPIARMLVAQGDSGVAGVVGGALVGDALARGGDVLAEGERVYATHAAVVGRVACPHPVAANAHVGCIGRAVHGAAHVVVGSESIAILVLADDGTHVGVGAGDA